MNAITEQDICDFEESLYNNEKSKATVEKYVLAVKRLADFLRGEAPTKKNLIQYRSYLQKKQKVQTVNGALSAINAYLDFRGKEDVKVKLLKVQRRAFLDEKKELTKREYERLLNAAVRCGNERLYLLMITLCGTGIRVGELVYITVEAVRAGSAEINLKGKIRTIVLQKELRKKLLKYAARQNIKSGYIFRTKHCNPLDRSNICHDMKKLCQEAGVSRDKVFPHNLRHLFARTFFAVERNLAHLADVLGHSRIETTRIYVSVSARSHERILNKMKLIL